MYNSLETKRNIHHLPVFIKDTFSTFRNRCVLCEDILISRRVYWKENSLLSVLLPKDENLIDRDR